KATGSQAAIDRHESDLDLRNHHGPKELALQFVVYIAANAWFAMATKRFIDSGSLQPGDDSTPLAVSTASGRTIRMASATFSAFNPPARINGNLIAEF